MTAAHTLGEAVETARAADDPLLRIEAALRYEDATWRPGLSDVAALDNIQEAVGILDSVVEAGAVVDNEPVLRARLAIGELRALAMSGRHDEADRAFEVALARAEELGSANVEASVLNVYLGHATFHEGSHDTSHMIRRLAELEPLIEDGDVAMHAVHVRLLHATRTGRFDEQQRARATPWPSCSNVRAHRSGSSCERTRKPWRRSIAATSRPASASRSTASSRPMPSPGRTAQAPTAFGCS